MTPVLDASWLEESLMSGYEVKMTGWPGLKDGLLESREQQQGVFLI
jgi:hypothetical protein